MSTRTMRWQRLFAPIAALFLALGLAACGDDDDSAGPDAGSDVEDVREDDELGVGDDEDAGLGEDDELGVDEEEDDFGVIEQEAFIGEQVTVSAEVAEMFSPSVLSIAGEGGPSPVLVVATAPTVVPADVSDNAVVRVTGTVHQLIEVVSFEDFETEFEDEGPFEFGDEDESFFESEELDQFEGDHFLIASSIEVLDPTEDGGDDEEDGELEDE